MEKINVTNDDLKMCRQSFEIFLKKEMNLSLDDFAGIQMSAMFYEMVYKVKSCESLGVHFSVDLEDLFKAAVSSYTNVLSKVKE